MVSFIIIFGTLSFAVRMQSVRAYWFLPVPRLPLPRCSVASALAPCASWTVGETLRRDFRASWCERRCPRHHSVCRLPPSTSGPQSSEAHLCTAASKAVTDRRLRPRCCRLGSYSKRPKSGSVRPLACESYYCAHFVAKPNAECALRLRFSWAATSSNLDWWAIMTSSIKPAVHNISLRRRTRTEPRPQAKCTKKFW